MENYLETRELPYSKYINWPSCDSEDWMWRYWGTNYNTLLHIKVRPRHQSDTWDQGGRLLDNFEHACISFQEN